jgi:hypothetical protein
MAASLLGKEGSDAKKREKCSAKRAAQPRRVSWQEQFTLDFGLNPAWLARFPWLRTQKNPENDPPSLDAKYRRLWKSCQEEFSKKVQNIVFQLSKASIYSGRHPNRDFATVCKSKRF